MNNDGILPIHSAVLSNSVEAVDSIINEYDNLKSVKDANGTTPLLLSINIKNKDVFIFLLQKHTIEGQMDEEDNLGITPL